MLRRPNYRDGLDATAAPGAGPAGSVEQEAADFPLLARSHLTPLAAPHDPCWRVERERERQDGRLDTGEDLQDVSVLV